MPAVYQIKNKTTPHYLAFQAVFCLGLLIKTRQNQQLQRITQQYTEGNITINKLWAGACEYITENGQLKTLTYLSGPEGVFALHVKNLNGTENIRYIHKDHLGSWHTITDENGNLLQELSFDAWGTRRNPETWQPFESPPPPLLFDRGYTWHEHIEKVALINMNGRVYDPKVARFLSPDPLIQSPGFSQSFNRYSYSLNNPINLVDRSGYYWDDYDDYYDDPPDPTLYGVWIIGIEVIASRDNSFDIILLPYDWHEEYSFIDNSFEFFDDYDRDDGYPQGQGGPDIYDWTNLGLNAANLYAYTIQTRQLPEMSKLDALGTLYIHGINSASKWCTRIGVGTSIASGALSIISYSMIENPTWGDKAQLTIGITSSVLSSIPYTTYVGVGIGLTDVAGGFNGWYNAWNSAEISYKTTGIAILPITSPTGFPIIIEKNK